MFTLSIAIVDVHGRRQLRAARCARAATTDLLGVYHLVGRRVVGLRVLGVDPTLRTVPLWP